MRQFEFHFKSPQLRLNLISSIGWQHIYEEDMSTFMNIVSFIYWFKWHTHRIRINRISHLAIFRSVDWLHGSVHWFSHRCCSDLHVKSSSSARHRHWSGKFWWKAKKTGCTDLCTPKASTFSQDEMNILDDSTKPVMVLLLCNKH